MEGINRLELTKEQIKRTKGVAIIFMVILHLFCRKDIKEYYDAYLYINQIPAIYYISLLAGSCVPIYCFASGYGLYIGYKNKDIFTFNKDNKVRIFKFIIKFWIVLVLTCIVGYSLGMKDTYPGSFLNLVCNLLLLKSSYCGAWWFVQTYIILVILSSSIFKIVDKYDSKMVIFISGVIYFISYLQRIKNIIPINNEVISLIVNAIVLLGTSQLAFLIGAVFFKESIYSKINNYCKDIKYVNIICLVCILGLIVVHGIVESMFIDPVIAVLFICLFNLIKLDRFSFKLWNYFGKHSTNIWLTHMLFYLYFAKDFVFSSRNIIVIFITVICLSLVSSYIIDLIYNPIIHLIKDKKLKEINQLSQ